MFRVKKLLGPSKLRHDSTALVEKGAETVEIDPEREISALTETDPETIVLNIPEDNLEFDPVTVLYLAVDCDGCLINNDYYEQDEFEKLTKEMLEADRRVITTNPFFWQYLENLLMRYPKIKHVRYIPFSARQSLKTDFSNCFLNKTESYFLVLCKFADNTQQLYPHLDVGVDPILTTDLHHDVPIGTAMNHAKSIYAKNHRINIFTDHSAYVYSNDKHYESKIDLTFLHGHRAVESFPGKRIHMVVLDDKDEIIDSNGRIYNSPVGKNAFCKKLSMEWHVYLGDLDSQQTIINPHTAIRCTGAFNPDYKQLFRDYWRFHARRVSFEDVISGKFNINTPKPFSQVNHVQCNTADLDDDTHQNGFIKSM